MFSLLGCVLQNLERSWKKLAGRAAADNRKNCDLEGPVKWTTIIKNEALKVQMFTKNLQILLRVQHASCPCKQGAADLKGTTSCRRPTKQGGYSKWYAFAPPRISIKTFIKYFCLKCIQNHKESCINLQKTITMSCGMIWEVVGILGRPWTAHERIPPKLQGHLADNGGPRADFGTVLPRTRLVTSDTPGNPANHACD